jgi:hypothetical protein
MRAALRCGGAELELHGPIATTLAVIAGHLGARPKATLDRIARIDRERAPGDHRFERDELLALASAAHALLVDPPSPVRRARRLPDGPHPAAERVAALASWLHAQVGDTVIYDLWPGARPA